MQFGAYVVQRAVEQYSSVTVYAAKDDFRKVLVSVFKPDSIESAQHWTERLLTLRRLQHPNIVAASESEITPAGEQYAISTFLPPLLGRDRVLSPQDLLEVTRQVSTALDFAHRLGLVHGAMKPAHIGEISPGQFAVRGWELTGAGEAETGDIAALGQFVHRALTGQSMADGKLSPRLPAALANVLHDTLPSGSGYKSASAFHESLSAAIKGLPQRNRPLVNAPQVKLSAPRRSNIFAVMGFVFVAFAVAAIATLLLLRQVALAQTPMATLAQIPTDTPTLNTTAVYDASDATAIPTRTPIPSPTEIPPTVTPLSVVTATSAAFTPGLTSIVTDTAAPTELATDLATELPTSTALPPQPKPCISMVGDSVTHGGITYEIPDTGYIVGFTHPDAEFVNQQLQANNINNLIAYDRGASNTGINSTNHPSYFKSQAYFNLLSDHCKYTVIMPWYNDITPTIDQADAAPQHVRAIIGMVNTLIAENPAGRILIFNYFQGNVASYAAETWAQGFTEENRQLYNHQIELSCDLGSLKNIPQVSCYNTDDAFAGMGSSYVIGQIGHDELMKNLVQPLSDLQQGWIDEYFSQYPNGQLQGDGIHLNSSGKIALANFIIKDIQSLPDLPSAGS